MKQETYHLLENYMLECMGDSAHINTSLKSCMIVSLQKEETKLQRNVRKRLLHSTMLCSKRSVIHITEE